jgi:hypothetical protein
MKNNQKNVLASRQGYEELYQLGYQTVELMVTDLLKFNEIGVSQVEVDELKQLTEVFGNRKFDEEFLLTQKLSTQEKEQLVDAMLAILYKLEMKLSLAFSETPMYIQAFGLGGIRKLSDVDVAKTARLMVSFQTGPFATALATCISEAELAELKEKNERFSAIESAQLASEKYRYMATQIRVAQANELYAYIRKIRNVGKKMWALTDIIRSNSYLMPKLRTGKSDGSDATNNDDFVVTNGETDNDENS